MKKNLTLRHRLIAAMPYSLLHFLIEWKILNQYCNYAVKEDTDGSFIRALENNQIKSPIVYFSYAFIWGHTSEGYDFWYRRAEWYKEYLNNLKTKTLSK